MKRIKKFESFNTEYRLPTKVSFDEWLAKSDMYGKEPFTQKEIDFFKKLGKENNLRYNYIDYIGENLATININNLSVRIHKLKDDWYLIWKDEDEEYDYEDEDEEYDYEDEDEEYDYEDEDEEEEDDEEDDDDEEDEEEVEIFICDEWDEVLGYLESINLKLPS